MHFFYLAAFKSPEVSNLPKYWRQRLCTISLRSCSTISNEFNDIDFHLETNNVSKCSWAANGMLPGSSRVDIWPMIVLTEAMVIVSVSTVNKNLSARTLLTWERLVF